MKAVDYVGCCPKCSCDRIATFETADDFITLVCKKCAHLWREWRDENVIQRSNESVRSGL
jgi:hypothetical protein